MTLANLMSTRQTLRNAYGTTGLFEYMEKAPWNDDETFGNTAALNYMYLRNRSGVKYIAPMLYDFLQEDGSVNSTDKQYIALTIWDLYGREWTKLWETYTLQYNPLTNYKITETHEDTTKKTGTESDNMARTGTESEVTDRTGTEKDVVDRTGTDTNTRTLGSSVAETGTIGDVSAHNMTENDTGSVTNTVNNSVYGFNSATASPANTSAQTGSSSNTTNITTDDTTNTRTLNTKRTGSGSDTDTLERDMNDERNYTRNLKDDKTLTRDLSDERSYERNLVDSNEGGWTREGALGYLTYQRMLMEERNLWAWDFFQRVFEDIDKVLTIPVMDMNVIIRNKYYNIGEI